MENQNTHNDSVGRIDHEVNLNLTARWAQERLAQLQKEREEARRARQAGRVAGQLTHSLVEKLRTCNVAQLRQAKKLCNRYMLDQRKAPPMLGCGDPYTVKIVESICVKNRRYQLEFRRTTRTGKKVYVNGPYIRVYHRDGAIIKVDGFSKKDKELYKRLPRKVWSSLKIQLNKPELENLRQTLMEQQKQLTSL